MMLRMTASGLASPPVPNGARRDAPIWRNRMMIGHGTPVADRRAAAKSAEPPTLTSGPSLARIGRYAPELVFLNTEGVTIVGAASALLMRFRFGMRSALADRRNRVACPQGMSCGPRSSTPLAPLEPVEILTSMISLDALALGLGSLVTMGTGPGGSGARKRPAASPMPAAPTAAPPPSPGQPTPAVSATRASARRLR